MSERAIERGEYVICSAMHCNCTLSVIVIQWLYISRWQESLLPLSQEILTGDRFIDTMKEFQSISIVTANELIN